MTTKNIVLGKRKREHPRKTQRIGNENENERVDPVPPAKRRRKSLHEEGGEDYVFGEESKLRKPWYSRKLHLHTMILEILKNASQKKSKNKRWLSVAEVRNKLSSKYRVKQYSIHQVRYGMVKTMKKYGVKRKNRVIKKRKPTQVYFFDGDVPEIEVEIESPRKKKRRPKTRVVSPKKKPKEDVPEEEKEEEEEGKPKLKWYEFQAPYDRVGRTPDDPLYEDPRHDYFG